MVLLLTVVASRCSTAPTQRSAAPSSTAGEPTDVSPRGGKGRFWSPEPRAQWQWQLTVPVDQSIPVPVYDIDLFDNPRSVVDSLHAQGRKVICYMDAGAWESYRPDSNRFPKAVIGNNTGWKNEKWLDIRQVSVIGPIISARMDLAVGKGCDAIEPDQDNGWENRPGFPLKREDSIRWNIWVANTAHAKGLSVGLKNSVGETAELEPYFDWNLNEECFQFNECDRLAPFLRAGKAVLQVEYASDPAVFCAQARALGLSSMKKHLNLDACD
jgi:hypothetical protein